jgi:hypothetical protein
MVPKNYLFFSRVKRAPWLDCSYEFLKEYLDEFKERHEALHGERVPMGPAEDALCWLYTGLLNNYSKVQEYFKGLNPDKSKSMGDGERKTLDDLKRLGNSLDEVLRKHQMLRTGY